MNITHSQDQEVAQGMLKLLCNHTSNNMMSEFHTLHKLYSIG